jgi:hypothetical protein
VRTPGARSFRAAAGALTPAGGSSIYQQFRRVSSSDLFLDLQATQASNLILKIEMMMLGVDGIVVDLAQEIPRSERSWA